MKKAKERPKSAGMAGARPRGRVPGVRTLYKREYATTAFKLASEGYTDAEVAYELNTTLTTFQVWRGKHPELEEKLRMGKHLDIGRLLRVSTRERAEGYVIELSEERIDAMGGTVEIKKQVHIPADPASLSIYCRNRIGNDWIDKVENRENIDENEKTPPMSIKIEIADQAKVAPLEAE